MLPDLCYQAMRSHPDIDLPTARQHAFSRLDATCVFLILEFKGSYEHFVLNMLFLFVVKDLQADLRKVTEELSNLRKLSETFDEELARTVKKVDEHQKVKQFIRQGRFYFKGR